MELLCAGYRPDNLSMHHLIRKPLHSPHRPMLHMTYSQQNLQPETGGGKRKSSKQGCVLPSPCAPPFEHTALYTQLTSPESLKIMIMVLLPLTSCSLINQNPIDLSHSVRVLLCIRGCEGGYFLSRQYNHVGVLLPGFRTCCRWAPRCLCWGSNSIYLHSPKKSKIITQILV